MSETGKRQFGDSELVLSVDLLEKPLKRRLELDFGDQAIGIDFDWAYAHLRAPRPPVQAIPRMVPLRASEERRV
jgi:hypothetical protein